jgi:tetratricopeptide (TPR) repeat protein
VPLPAIGGGAVTPFVGRSEQLGRLRARWLDAAAGRRCFVLLAGEPGVGKTRLAAQFASEVHCSSGTVLYGRCDEEPLLAYQPFVEALGRFLRYGEWDADPDLDVDLNHLRRLMPEAGPDADAASDVLTRSPGSGRYLLFEAVGRLLGRATRRRPVLLVLDDLHWADKPTLLLLRHMLRLTDPARLMVLGIFRDVEVDHDDPLAEFVADMRRESRFDRVALAGFDERETDALVAAHLKAPASDAFVRALCSQTDGNPFFMEESLRSLVESHSMEFGDEATEEALASMGVPDGVADVILRRLGRVAPVTRDALTAAALIGREFDINIVRDLLGMPAEPVISAMEEAMVAGLVIEVPDAVDRFSFRHALVRDAIYDRLSASRRCRSHLRVGRALEAAASASDSGPEELAHHFFLARQVGGAAEAVRYAIAAGEKAARALAYEEAAAHYRRAREAFADDPDADEARRCDVLLALGRVQWQAGDAEARETYFEAAASARERGAAEQLAGAALGLGERYWEAGAVDEQYQELLTEALDTLSRDDSRLRARLMARMAENLHFTTERELGARLSVDAVAMARRLGDTDTLVTALMGRHVALLHVEHLDERLALIDEVLRLAKGHRALTAEAHHWRLFDLCELGDVTEAHRDHAELSRLSRELRQPLLEHLALGWRGAFAHLSGDIVEAERLALECYSFAARAQVRHGSSSLASMLFTVRRQQGRIGELLPSMRSLADGVSANGAWRAALALAEVETGHVDAGRARYELLAGRDFAGIPRDWYWTLTAALMTETCVTLGDVDRAPRLYALLEPFAERCVQIIFTTCWGSIHRYLGLLATVMGRFEEAEHHFQAAVAGNTRMGAVLMTAETECAYGAMLLRRDHDGDREHAAALGARAHATAAARDLGGLGARARALMDASGI